MKRSPPGQNCRPQGGMQFDIQPELKSKPYVASCLPKTMEVANVCAVLIRRHLPAEYREWCFPDRVLIWLCPAIIPSVRDFYEKKGKCLGEIYSKSKLDSLDKKFAVLLMKEVAEIRFGRKY